MQVFFADLLDLIMIPFYQYDNVLFLLPFAMLVISAVFMLFRKLL